MKTAYLARSVGCFIVDTFRQSLASGVCWFLLATIVICTVVCFSISIDGAALASTPNDNAEFLPRKDRDAADPKKATSDGVAVASGAVSLGFGSLQVPLARDAQSAVWNLELLLAGGVADTLGLLFALVWTAGFLPQFLDRRNIAVLLTKPCPRWCLLAGKYLGVLVFVLMYGVLFVGTTWLALGLRTGVWNLSYWWCVPLLVLHFAIFFSFSLLLAVVTRSTVACVFGSIVFWLVCWAMNYGRHAVILAQSLAPESAMSDSVRLLADIGYWILPKPADLNLLLFDALDARHVFQQPFDVTALREAGFFSIELSVVTSLAFMAYVLLASAQQFASADY